MPSRRNSGWKQTWKSVPSCLPDAFSIIGRSTSSTVPGTSVERNTKVCTWSTVGQRRAELARQPQHGGLVLAAVGGRRRADADQRHLAVAQGLRRRRW